MAARPRLVVVSYAAHRSTPVGLRTQELIRRLGRTWDVSLVAGPESEPVVRRSELPRWAWTVARNLLSGTVLLDAHEPWSKRRFARWRPAADTALLIGWPFSPLFAAARRLARRGIPYVVYVGDPFALTSGATRPVRGIARWRGARLEARMWRGAAGAIVTTPSQAAALRGHFPQLPTLVRPNGYRPETWEPDAVGRRERPGRDELRLVYFGHFWPRVHTDWRWFFEGLVESGLWPSITLDHYSSEATGDLRASLPDAVRYRHHGAVPWERATRAGGSYDLALVAGARRGVQLPSKVIAYLTLPIPRVAVVESVDDDAISTYLAGRRGWLIVDRADPELPGRIAEHASRHRTAEDLAPPPEESWPRVAEVIEAFLADRLEAGGRSAAAPARQPPQPG